MAEHLAWIWRLGVQILPDQDIFGLEKFSQEHPYTKCQLKPSRAYITKKKSHQNTSSLYMEWCMDSNGKLSMHSQEGYFDIYILCCFSAQETNSKIIILWEHDQFVLRIHTSFYFLHDLMNPLMPLQMMICTYQPRVSLTWFMFCWWHHNPLLMTSQMHYHATISIF